MGRTEGQDSYLTIRAAVAAVFCSVPWLFFFVTYALSPGYVQPFVDDVLGKVALLLMALWDALWFFILLRTRSAIFSLLIIVFFVLPLTLVPMLAPAGLTIIKAVGPVASDKGVDKSGQSLASKSRAEAERLSADAGLRLVNGGFDAAIQMCTRAIALDPTYEYAYVQRGYAHQMAGHDDAALADFKKAVELDPKDYPARSRMGYLLAKRGLNQEALEQYSKTLEIQPDDSRTILLRAQLYDKLGMPDKAVADRAKLRK